MEGEDDDSDDERSFSKKNVWQRMLIIVSGVTMNMLTGLVIMVLLLVQRPSFKSTEIKAFSDDAVSSTTGLQVGDVFKSVNGYRIVTNRDLMIALFINKGDTFNMQVERNGQIVDLENVKFASRQNDEGQTGLVIDFDLASVDKNFGTVAYYSVNNCVSLVREVWVSLFGLITGKFSFKDVSGPVRIVSAVSQAASAGMEVSFLQAINNILEMMAMIAVNLAVMNILPLPALDGGRLLFLLIEAIRRKPVNQKYEGYVHAAGIALLIGLMVLIMFNDIFRLFVK